MRLTLSTGCRSTERRNIPKFTAYELVNFWSLIDLTLGIDEKSLRNLVFAAISAPRLHDPFSSLIPVLS